MMQLLVSLSIGTLVENALIHILPHALQTGHGDSSVVCKGFVAIMINIVLFVVDQVMELVGHRHSHGHGHEENQSEDALSFLTPSIDDKSTQKDLEIMIVKLILVLQDIVKK